MNNILISLVSRMASGVPSRREVVRGLAGAGLGLGRARISDPAVAKKRKRKNKHKHKKKERAAKPNEFGCLEVGDACKGADQCCSGICEGKKCRAHGTGTCEQGVPGYCQTSPLELDKLICNNDFDCFCLHTTAGSNFCALLADGSACVTCQRDTDCAELGFPAGSACVPVSERHCAGTCESGMMCLLPCGYVPPEP